MSSVVCRIAQAAYFAVLSVFVALWVAGMVEGARGLLAPMWLLVGVQFGALGYGRRHKGEEQ